MNPALAVLEVTWSTVLGAKHRVTGHPDTSLIPVPGGLCCAGCRKFTRGVI